MIKSTIYDSQRGRVAKVSEEGALNVVVHPHPPSEALSTIPYRDFLKDSAGSTDMRVDGSSTNVEYCITALSEFDIYINSINFAISDAGAALNEFGAITALTNGCLFEWITADLGSVTLHEGLKSNYDFVRLCNGSPPVGDGANAFRANNVEGLSEGYIPTLDFSDAYGLPWGIRLRKGTTDKLCLTIRDNTTAIDKFDAVVFGFKLSGE